MYGYWIRCDVSAGNIVIHEEMPEGHQGNELTIRLERPCDEGKVLISDIPDKGCILTVYAISPDGKTWYKRAITVPPRAETPATEAKP